jgi:hypothetical protein
MSRFTCDSLTAHFRTLFGSCYFTPSSERQKLARDKLSQQLSFLAYEKKQLEQQIEEHDRRKTALLRAKRVREAKDVVRDKHKLMKKYDKTRELYSFTDTLLEQLNDTTTLRDTMSTIHEAQRVYMSIDAPKIYEKFDRLSDKFVSFQEQVAETQDLVNSRLAGTTNSVEDAELLAELEACEMPPASAVDPTPLPAELTPPASAGGGITAAYARILPDAFSR